MSKIEVGKEYDLTYRQKGTVRIRVKHVDGPVVSGIVTKGQVADLSELAITLGNNIQFPADCDFIALTPAGE